MSEPLKHLLIRGEFKVYCRPRHSPAALDVTDKPSKATCAVCITAWRSKTKGFRRPFRVFYTGRKNLEEL